MSFQSTFYRSLIYFHAIIAIAEFLLTFTLIIAVLHNSEIFFKITGPDDEDWNLIAEGYRIAIWILFLIACLLDYYHYRVWWHYKPQFTDIGFFFEMPTTPLSRKHKRYIPYHLLGDHRTESFGDRTCSAGVHCKNRQLEHIFIFHFRGYNPQRRYFDIIRADNPKNLYIGFHQTDPASAVLIAHSDFRISTGSRSTMLGHGIYFARSREGTEKKANRRGAFICAEINMGRVFYIRSHKRSVYSGKKTWWSTHDTAYYCHRDPKFDEFCVKSPNQILRWIIVIEKQFDKKVENYGLDTEFDDTKCGCF
ncbi:unnamed protein product [Adineta ricciae]|uniref:PARP catalytic domain-containing protein n=1 Tax=Adineta ricciae TaxID=249248 RepID=A0A815A417_ADIRI|nr:unnamed protein product [Adineta ricciae]